MKQELTQIQLQHDEPNSYYIGYIVSQNQELTTMICLDQEGNEGGVHLFSNKAIVQKTSSSADINFYQYLIDRGMSKDPFRLSALNETVIKQHFATLAAALACALKKQQIITIDTSDGFAYTGLITAVNEQNAILRLKSDDFALEAFATVIPLRQIECLSFNIVNDLQFASWLQLPQQPQKKLNLVQIYLNYQGDDRYGSCLTGRIIAQTNHHRILVEKYNEVGQISAMALVNYDHILHISKQSPALTYLAYQIKQNQRKGIRDPYGLIDMIRMSGSIFDLQHLPTVEKVLAWEKDAKNLINVDDVDYSAPNIGLITAYQNQQFTQQVLEDYHLGKAATYQLSRIAAIDLFSTELLQLQLYLDENKKRHQ